MGGDLTHFINAPPGGSKARWAGFPELFEAFTDRWPGQ
jgi:hypothetical protein